MTTADTAVVPRVKAEGLRFSIGSVVRVGPIDLTLRSGRTLGIVGETGSAKSLLCRTLVGMLEIVGGQIDGGRLEIDGRELAGADRATWAKLRRTSVGYMPQASMSGLNPVRRVGAQLRELLEGSRADRTEQARELLRQVQLHDTERVLKAYPHELSGGMRQRVMLAFSLIGDPNILVADEPTTALDATVQAEVLRVIKEVQEQRHMSVIVVSHDMRVIKRMCDDIAIMYCGRVVEQGPIEDIVARPRHPYTRALLQADPIFAERKTPLGAVRGAPRPPADWNDGGCNFRERCPFATAVCETSDPELLPRGPVRVACHNAEEVERA